MTIPRRHLLGGALAALAAGLVTRRARAADSRRLLVYWISGGWDPTYTMDPHLDSSIIQSDDQATLSTVGGIPIADAASRPAVRDFFSRWGAQSVVFNGVAVGSISHDACTRLVLTGTRSGTDMDVCTRVAAGSGAELALPHAVLGGPRFAGANGALVHLVSPTFVSVAAGRLPTPRDEDQEARVSAWLEAELAATGRDTLRQREFLQGLNRLPVLASFAREFATVDLGQEAGRREVAMKLFAADATRTVLLGSSVANMAQWDSHLQNHLNQDRCFEHSFGQLALLMEELAATTGPDGAPLSTSTRVLVLSEMGRQPVLNQQEGKDHWPITSALLVGADVRGGRVVGGTDDVLAPRAVDLASGELDDGGEILRPGHLIATLAEGFGLDPAEWADGETAVAGIWA